MGFFQKLKEGVGKAAEEAGDFAQTAKVRMEIGHLNDRKAALITEIGTAIYARCDGARAVPEVAAQCQEIRELEDQIHARQAHIERINAEEPGAPAAPGGTGSQA